ncbi:neutral zinc metallopeptidase [Pannus brasiliensis CCIBt3594]|uniref:Neutral zinc metallopeptidase n=1 Tax=Pannus brasiliensis CCIBt3594 TaxID=1427578 RepID=A0AAW9R062_9CHRO
MRWQFGRRSNNVEDQRGSGGIPGGMVVSGGIGTVILALIAMFLGVDPSIILNGAVSVNNNPYPAQNTAPGQTSPREDKLADFVSVVLADTEDTWSQIFRENGAVYQEPRLVLFSGTVQSACGYAQAAMGPFYCPADRKVYIDLSFYQDLKTRHNSPGDFAQAYVVAHEIGHHVQNLLGISSKVQSLQKQVGEVKANQLSVRLELQADCFAGVWANRADRERQIIESGDVEEALNAASNIGDDRLQSQARGYVVPDSFTHGSSAQRVRWFRKGLQTGDINQCDTFSVAKP